MLQDVLSFKKQLLQLRSVLQQVRIAAVFAIVVLLETCFASNICFAFRCYNALTHVTFFLFSIYHTCYVSVCTIVLYFAWNV